LRNEKQIAMACNASTCESNCYRNEEQAQEKAVDSSTNPIADENNQNQNVCVKCKFNEPISATGGEDGRFCAECFRSNLYGKFRLAVTSHAMISPTDNVLVAFSGGTSSRSPPLSLSKIVN
jgi:cytoplasmic tRNA 2-thiolation protein 2